MKKFKFKKMDAFASGLSTGNPAAAVYLDSFDDITEQEMQRIARELKGFVSEVGFIAEIDKDTYKLRYFSSEKEVEFCGHATIAIMYDLRGFSPLPSGISKTRQQAQATRPWGIICFATSYGTAVGS